MILEDLAASSVEAALAAGATDAEAWCEESVSREIKVYQGAVESLSDAGGRGMGLRAFVDRQAGYAYSTDLGDEGRRALALAAYAAASVADPDEHAGLPEECGATEVPGLASPEMGAWSTEQKIELALAVERAARSREGVSQVEDAVFADGEQHAAIAN